MVVAVAVLLMVQVSGDKVVDVVTMRNCLVAAVFSVNVRRVVTRAVMSVGAISGVLAADLKRVLINVPIMHVMKQACAKKAGKPSLICNSD